MVWKQQYLRRWKLNHCESTLYGCGGPIVLKKWSGRRDSNPRRPAWEIDYTLTIKNMAFMASIASDDKSPIFNDLFQGVPYRNKNGTKDNPPRRHLKRP